MKDIFEGKPRAKRLFDALRARIEAEFEGVSIRDEDDDPIGFYNEHMFAGAWVREDWKTGVKHLEVSFYLDREIDSTRFRTKIERPLCWSFFVPIVEPEDIDDELMGWLRASYTWAKNKKHRYVMKYWFEWGHGELWSADDETDLRYGYPVDLDLLPISGEMRKWLRELSDEHNTALNWDSPAEPSPWTEEQKRDFKRRAREAYDRLTRELGDDYLIVYNVKV